MSGEEERKVEEILDTRISKDVKQFHVKWTLHDGDKSVIIKKWRRVVFFLGGGEKKSDLSLL